MAGSKAVAYGAGINFSGLLTLLLIWMKLSHQIEWSWFWVLLPMMIPAVIVVVGMLLFLIGMFIEEFSK